jgi:hypothetical protein
MIDNTSNISDEQKFLEQIIDKHFEMLDYYKNNSTINRGKILRETTILGTYISCYGLIEKHPRYWEYNGKLLDLGIESCK